jgi:ABC-type uncharacterized transport system substrate-binding protein
MEAHRPQFATRAPALPARAVRPALRLLCLACFTLSGCALIPDAPPPEPLGEIPPPRHEQIPPIVVEPPPTEDVAEPAAPVAIIVSGDSPAYVNVADSLIAQLGDDAYISYVLADSQAEADTQQAAEFFDRDIRAVVAVGLPAALFATRNVTAPLIFCQVFNYSDYPELGRATAGVSMLAAFDEQLAFWKALDASLESVGTIVGPGHDQLIARSSAAAAAQGITLDARISNSDRETVYEFKRLSAEIDGFWLIPDNRILSVKAIEELMSYAALHSLPVVVSTPELLRFGALMSLAPSPSHVADSVLSVLGSLQNFITSGFEIVDPKEFEVDFNEGVAMRLGIGSY